MFIESLILAMILGYIFGGRLKNLENVNLNKPYIIVFAFLIELLVKILLKNDKIQLSTLTLASDIVMYALIFIFVYLNRKNIGIILIGVGSFLNALVIFANGGNMPVSLKAIDVAHLTHNVQKSGLYAISNSKTKLIFLSDIIPIPYIIPNISSIGDLFIAIGIIYFVIRAMKTKIENNEAVLNHL